MQKTKTIDLLATKHWVAYGILCRRAVKQLLTHLLTHAMKQRWQMRLRPPYIVSQGRRGVLRPQWLLSSWYFPFWFLLWGARDMCRWAWISLSVVWSRWRLVYLGGASRVLVQAEQRAWRPGGWESTFCPAQNFHDLCGDHGTGIYTLFSSTAYHALAVRHSCHAAVSPSM